MLAERFAARAAGLAACAVLFLACQDHNGAGRGAPVVVLHTDTTATELGVVDVVNLDRSTLRAFDSASPTIEQWHAVLSVQTAGPVDSDSTALPLLGNYSVERDRLRFRPRFVPARGQSYRARFDAAALHRVAGVASSSQATIDTTWQLPARTGAARTTVLALYPSSDRLPVNLLRIYLHFSAPMSMGEAYQRVHLVDDEGNDVRDAFLVVAGEKELWDPERKRLTVLFDPGRIKRDLRPNLEAGLPLREGHTFTIVVDSVWQDAHGQPLRQPFHKRFTVVPADRTSPRTQDWQLTPPRAGTRDTLTLRFPESLDRALLERLLSVRSKAGVIAGKTIVDGNETRWRFVPDAPWQAGGYSVEVGTELEDVAGNNLRRLFDVDRKTTPAPTITADRVQVAFTVR